MKIVVIGASGTIGQHVSRVLKESGHEVIRLGRNSGQYSVNLEKPETLRPAFEKIGKFDALVNAAGDIAFAPLADFTQAQWEFSLRSKLMGQIHLVQEALPYLNPKGSITLVTGTLSEEPILGGIAATTVGSALEGFVRAAAFELPHGIRINAVSPGLLEDSVEKFGSFFPGFIPVSGEKVGQAFKKAVMGIQNGKVIRVTT